MMSFVRTLGFSFVLYSSLKNGGLGLLMVLNISIGRFLILLMFMVALLDFLSKVSYSLSVPFNTIPRQRFCISSILFYDLHEQKC